MRLSAMPTTLDRAVAQGSGWAYMPDVLSDNVYETLQTLVQLTRHGRLALPAQYGPGGQSVCRRLMEW